MVLLLTTDDPFCFSPDQMSDFQYHTLRIKKWSDIVFPLMAGCFGFVLLLELDRRHWLRRFFCRVVTVYMITIGILRACYAYFC